jgi:hypothetical protein
LHIIAEIKREKLLEQAARDRAQAMIELETLDRLMKAQMKPENSSLSVAAPVVASPKPITTCVCLMLSLYMLHVKQNQIYYFGYCIP